jgi:hypothetical protein
MRRETTPAPWILALNIGAQTGIAFGSRTVMLSTQVDVSLRPRSARRSWSLLDRLDQLLRTVGTSSLYVLEGPTRRRKTGRPTRLKDEVNAAVADWARSRNVEYVRVRRGAMLKCFTRNGNASGDAVLDECENRGFHPCSVAEAKAIGLYEYALDSLEREAAITAERDV